MTNKVQWLGTWISGSDRTGAESLACYLLPDLTQAFTSLFPKIEIMIIFTSQKFLCTEKYVINVLALRLEHSKHSKMLTLF